MSTSGMNDRREIALMGLRYLMASVGCALFGAVYEAFSYGVYSYGMIYAFAFPLCGGALPCLTLAFMSRRLPGSGALRRYGAGIATWTVGAMVQGALEIYGTSNRLTQLYWYAGALLVISGLIPWRRIFRRPRVLPRG